ncbi:3-deoxy-manno-octulosonate cytidylyltransferase [Patescibacteria group bacterium]|nr:3-deoxy-manno-octulosonate cytidylyltransferase [Patescibacteria group bacterium]
MDVIKNLGVIPARLGSGRFPNKPLKEILGMPMLGHIYKRSCLSTKLDYVCVATYDKEIVDYIDSIGGKAILIREQYERPTECVAAAVREIEKECGQKVENILMIQGDEPMVNPEVIEALASDLEKNENEVVNIVNKINHKDEYFDKDIVKMVVDKLGRILWFFRLPSPFWEEKARELSSVGIQTGIIGFKRRVLFLYSELMPTDFEKANSVDMFRFLEHGINIKALFSKIRLYSVDTPSDLEMVEKVMSQDPLTATYNVSV